MGYEVFDRLPSWAKDLVRENNLYLDEYQAQDIILEYGVTPTAELHMHEQIKWGKRQSLHFFYGSSHPDIT